MLRGAPNNERWDAERLDMKKRRLADVRILSREKLMAWNFGDILDKISLVLPPDAPALIHGERIITWADTTRRSNNLARGLLASGASNGDKVAFYMRNRPEYVETMAACFKSRLVHVNA
ncbi:MAG: AMP-binding protein, partial [Bradyrhizobium sp.]